MLLFASQLTSTISKRPLGAAAKAVALAVMLWLCAGLPHLVAAEIVSVSADNRRAQAPAIAVTGDGTIHAVWFDKGAMGEADRKGARVGGSRHSHQAFADLYYAQWQPGQPGFSQNIRINPEVGQVWGFSISRPVIDADAEGRIHVVYPVKSALRHPERNDRKCVVVRPLFHAKRPIAFHRWRPLRDYR